MQERELRVGIGDMKFTRGTGKIITYALGSLHRNLVLGPLFYIWERFFILCFLNAMTQRRGIFINTLIPVFMRQSGN